MPSLIDRVNSVGNKQSTKGLYSSYSGDGAFIGNLFNGGIDRNSDLLASEYGAAQASQLISDIQAAIGVWETYLDGIEWEIRDGRNDEILATTKQRTYPANERGGRFFNAIKKYRERFKHSYWKSIAISDWVVGETYIFRVPNNAGVPTNLMWLNPLNTEAQDRQGKIEYYHYYGDDSSDVGYKLGADEVAYRMLRRNLFDDTQGFSSVLSAIDSVNLTRNVKRAFRQYFRNGMVLGGLISPVEGETWSSREVKRVEEQLQRNHRGTANAHAWSVMPARVLAEAFDQKNASQDMDVLNQLSRDMSTATGVPTILYGDPADATYQNLQEARRGWWSMRANPYAQDIATYHNNQILPYLEPDSDVYLTPNLAPYEVDDPNVVSQDVSAGYIPIDIAQSKRGYTVDPDLADIYLVNGVPMHKSTLIALSRQIPAETQLDMAQADEASEQADAVDTETDLLEAGAPNEIVSDEVQRDYEIKQAPEQTTFSSVTYNGVTVQASPVQPSSRDDKKFMRYVRYDGDERLVHWGQPGEQMERDNEQAREDFNSRHSCDTKKDPFSAGFWACWAWQPSADVRSKKALPRSREAFAYIPLSNDSNVLRFQRQLKALLPNDERIEWETAPTFHVTLCYAEGVTDEQIDAMAMARAHTVELRPQAVEVFDTPNGQAVHIRLENSYTLLELQDKIYAEFLEQQADGISEYSKPENFKPHITLAYVPDDIDVSKAISVEDVYPSFNIKSNQVIIGRDNYEPVIILNANERKQADTLPYRALLQADSLYPDSDTIDERIRDELMTWYTFEKKRYGKSDTRDFVPEYIEPYIRFAVIDRLDDTSTLEGVKTAILDVLDDAHVKTVGAYRRKARSLFFRFWNERIGYSDFLLGMNKLIEQQYTQAFNKGVKQAGKKFSDLSGNEQAELDMAIIEEKANVFKLIRDMNEDRIREDVKLDKYRTRAELWIARYDSIQNLGYITAMEDKALMWVRDARKESCQTCIKLDGKVYTASIWRKLNIRPRSHRLACFGGYCGCEWKPPPDGTGLSQGRPPKIP